MSQNMELRNDNSKVGYHEGFATGCESCWCPLSSLMNFPSLLGQLSKHPTACLTQGDNLRPTQPNMLKNVTAQDI